MSEELINWLRAHLQDDITVAERVLRFSRDGYRQGAPYESWVAERKVNHDQAPYFDYQLVRTERPGTVQREIIRLPGNLGMDDAEHISRFASPRRVLLDLKAKWDMIDDILGVPRFRRDPLLKLLALPYDRPGYQEAWRP